MTKLLLSGFGSVFSVENKSDGSRYNNGEGCELGLFETPEDDFVVSQEKYQYLPDRVAEDVDKEKDTRLDLFTDGPQDAEQNNVENSLIDRCRLVSDVVPRCKRIRIGIFESPGQGGGITQDISVDNIADAPEKLPD